MDRNGQTRFRHRKPLSSSDRLLGASDVLSPPDRTSSSSFSPTDELSEDDIFTADFSQSRTFAVQQATPPSSSCSSPRHPHHHKPFPNSDFGILGALRDPSRPSSHFYQKPSISTSVASSSSSAASSSSSKRMMIPSIPRPTQERIPFNSVSSAAGRCPQSAPVNIPVLATRMGRNKDIDEDYYDEDPDGEGEMLPPHEIVARSLAQSPILACSVLEGVGRTLKGRDLRQVRNAIWRRTGFLD